MKNAKLYLFVILMGATLSGKAQQQPCSCCTQFHQQFDFWSGDWIVSDQQGNVVGENRIEKIENGCILAEHWTGSKGVTGKSYNYFDSSDSTWNQLWLDSQGSILQLKGRFESGKMILKSKEFQGRGDQTLYNQISWSKNDDGTVTQHWELYNQAGEKVRTLFLGIYTLREDK